jgi:hypothetical protein
LLRFLIFKAMVFSFDRSRSPTLSTHIHLQTDHA